MADLVPAIAGLEVSARSSEDVDRPKLEPQVTSISVDSKSSDLSPGNELSSVGITELLDLDDRPTFVLDLQKPAGAGPVYYNQSLQDLKLVGLDVGKCVVESFTDGTSDPNNTSFLDWSTSTAGKEPATYCGIKWSANTLRGRWRVIFGIVGNAFEPNARIASPDLSTIPRQLSLPIVEKNTSMADTLSCDPVDKELSAFMPHREDRIPTIPAVEQKSLPIYHERHTEYESLGAFDITAPNPLVPLSPHIKFFLGFDWGSTELGPINTWSTELRRMCNLLMTDPRPAAMYWGKQRTVIYNEPYIHVTGQKHPWMMGKVFSLAWSEVEDAFAPGFVRAYATGQPDMANDALFYLDRNGYLEETYYSISMIPFNSEGGEVAL